ncbi:MAG: hypothetical protein K0A98_10055 [Trueperaceae bacterium]|nr:hypothetical protein [Trueperaceae bacterium]
MWLARQLDAVLDADRPVLLLGGEAHGTPYLLEALRARRRTAWWTLPHATAGDDVAQGNALAEALNGVLEAPLLPQALPYRAHLQMLRHHAADLQPLWLAVTTALADAPALRDLAGLHAAGYGVVIDLRGHDAAPDLDGVSGCLRLGPDELRLSLAEAAQVVPGGLDHDRVAEVWRATGGRFTELVRVAHAAVGLPPLHVPSPSGPLLPAERAEPVPTALAVRALARKGAWTDALELAVLAVPELVEELLRSAGPAFHERGLTRRLHLLLSALPPTYARQERVLEWRLVAAADVGELPSVLPDVDAHLAAHRAPELRARRAGSLPHAEGFALAEQAVRDQRTPLTLWQYGRLHPDFEAAAALLEESVRLAEDFDSPHAVARNAGALAAKLVHVGDFARARAWAQFALGVFDQHQLRDGARRLRLVNDLAFARLLTGDVAGLRRSLADTAAALTGAMPAVADLYRSTWAAVELAGGDPQASLDLLRPLVEGAPRARRAAFAQQAVRALLDLDRVDDAIRVAEDTVELAAGMGDHAGRVAGLARGMAHTVRAARAGDDPHGPSFEHARDDLLAVMTATDLAAELRLPAALYYLLATGGAAHHVPPDLARILAGLHPLALRLFAGPADLFAPIWDAVGGGGPRLRLRFFGAAACRLDGAVVDLSPRLAEVALALTLAPDGVSRDGLNDFLTPDHQPPFTGGGLRGLLTRLRGLLPVSEAPYRWTVPFAADVTEVRGMLAEGRVREAIALWQGPLLPLSEAPGVREARETLEESLRQAALVSGDADALYELADRWGDDLALWEAAAEAMPPGDPRLALALARVRRLAAEYG